MGVGSQLRQRSWTPPPSASLVATTVFHLWRQFFRKQNLLTEVLSSVLVFLWGFYFDFEIRVLPIMKVSPRKEPEGVAWSSLT